MNKEDRLNDFIEEIKKGIIDLRVGVCPIWQCGGELEYLEERTNWQEPDLRCKNCGAVWLLQSMHKSEDDVKVKKT